MAMNRSLILWILKVLALQILLSIVLNCFLILKLQLLLDNKARIDALDYGQSTPLHKAAGHNHRNVVKDLIRRYCLYIYLQFFEVKVK